MASKTNEFDQQMAGLEAELKRLEAEYNMFFAGRLARLPWETRARVAALVKRYDRMQLRNTADRFRFSTLQARYAAFCDLWDRHLKAREEGRPIHRGRGVAAQPPETPPPARAARPERSERESPRESGPRVVAEAAIRDPSKDVERLQQLYEQLSTARKQAGEEPLPYDRFTQVVKAQVSKLGQAGEVAFKVTVEGGKVTLAAKAKDE